MTTSFEVSSFQWTGSSELLPFVEAKGHSHIVDAFPPLPHTLPHTHQQHVHVVHVIHSDVPVPHTESDPYNSATFSGVFVGESARSGGRDGRGGRKKEPAKARL